MRRRHRFRRATGWGFHREPIRCKQGYSARPKPACLSATDLVKVSMPAGRMFLADKMPPQLLAKVWGNCGFFSSGSASPAMGPVTFPGWLQCESIVIGSPQKKYRCGTQRTGVHPVSRYFHCSQLLNYCMEEGRHPPNCRISPDKPRRPLSCQQPASLPSPRIQRLGSSGMDSSLLKIRLDIRSRFRSHES